MTSFTTPVLAFLAVIALIPLVLWLLKRTPVGGGASGRLMRTVAALPLAANQRVVTVEVGRGGDRRWLVLGVTPGSITTLWTMEPQAEADPQAPPQAHFAQLLSRLSAGDRGPREP